MGLRDSSIADGMGAKMQRIYMRQAGNNVDLALGVTLPKGTHGNPVIANGRIKEVWAYNETLALVGGGTTESKMDIQPHIIDASIGAPVGGITTGFAIPVTALTDMRLSSNLAASAAVTTDISCKRQALALSDDALETGTTGSNSTATEIVLTGGSAVDGYYVGATVRVISGPAAGTSRLITKYVGSTKVATIATTGTAITTGGTWAVLPRRRIVKKGDIVIFLLDFTVGTGSGSPAAGTDLLCGVTIEFDDNVS